MNKHDNRHEYKREGRLVDKHQNEKKRLEREAAKLFIQCYNLTAETKYRLLYQQERPDAVLQDSKGGKLGVEITHLYYDEEEARMLLGRSAATEHAPEFFSFLLLTLNELIRKKERKVKEYSHDYPLALLIRNTSPIFRFHDFARAADQIYVPREGFEQIWLLSRNEQLVWKLLTLVNHQ